MNKNVKRIDLASSISKRLGIKLKESSRFVDEVFEQISCALKEEKVAKISFFGSFYVRHKKERMGRNPKTMEDAVIPAFNSISFYPSAITKRKINTQELEN